MSKRSRVEIRTLGHREAMTAHESFGLDIEKWQRFMEQRDLVEVIDLPNAELEVHYKPEIVVVSQ